MSSSVGNGMVGGTVADLFRAKQRGLAMNVFAVLNFIGGVRCPQTGNRTCLQIGTWEHRNRMGRHGRRSSMGIRRKLIASGEAVM